MNFGFQYEAVARKFTVTDCFWPFRDIRQPACISRRNCVTSWASRINFVESCGGAVAQPHSTAEKAVALFVAAYGRPETLVSIKKERLARSFRGVEG